MIYETFREAVKNIWSNKFRTVLTMLGIIIGVTAVIVIVGLGNGMTQSIKDSFSEMGTNVLSVQITGRGSRTVTVQQMYDIVDSHPEVFTGMSPTTTLDSTVKVDTTTYGYTSVKGVSETYLDMMGRTLAQGRGLTYVDITDNKKSAWWAITLPVRPTAATPSARPSRSAVRDLPSWACWKPMSAVRPIRRAPTMT